MKERLRVLVSAYACNPYKGSEEGVGWGWVKAISRLHNLHVITAEYNRHDIEKESQKFPDECSNLKFYYVPHKPWHYKPTKVWLKIEGSFLKPIMNWSYRLWLRDAYKMAIKLTHEINFDLIHQLTYVGFRFPGHLWKLNIPFVWGPIGGLENTPWRFLPVLGIRGAVYFAGRNIINSLHKRFLSGPKKAFKKARGGIIAATEGIRREILKWYGVESEIICEIGSPLGITDSHSIRNQGEKLKLSWSGQHLPGKALPLLLKALTQLPADINWHLDILGDGPCTKKWQRLASRLGINNRCQWHGWLPREDALRIVHQSHIFIITSLKDLTSTVLLEALSQGVPVICPDHCGFSNVVTEECGIKLPIESPKQLEEGIADAILKLAKDEEERRRLAKGALKRINDFSWEKKAELVDAIYKRKLES
ncbi:MAG: glycosyltransferase family 4 protein [Thermodesulfovibrionales bacterium]|nr:glycosyltransferase family 4 protein [Thermodesulfovibrionales bacterium]